MPARLRGLVPLAKNLWWSWAPDGRELFRDLDPDAWERLGHNPRRLLMEVPEPRLAQLAADPIYSERVARLVRAFDEYIENRARWTPPPGCEATADRPVAYFSAEFGIHESLPVYSGGLGMLAGDHLKSASDLGLPMVGVGLLYRQGYFQQRFDRQGWQQEFYTDLDVAHLPLELVMRDGSPVTVKLGIRKRTVTAQVWLARVGRVPLYLLDTNRDDNDDLDRWITGHLYGGDHDTRIVQEVLLGIGGVRMLRALEIVPSVYHMNEGHSAFATLELAREAVSSGLTFEEAAREVRCACVFTTHTPVPAGNDNFTEAQMTAYFEPYWKALGLDKPTFLGIGRRKPEDPMESFGMTPLAIRMSRKVNGVSRRHGQVCQEMWGPLLTAGEESLPKITHVTNGIHHPTWVAPVVRELYARHLGPDWESRADDPEMWRKIDRIPDAELWDTHCRLRRYLVALVRQRSRKARLEIGEPAEHVAAAATLLDPEVLTIGFARRVATYKRWDLLLSDPERIISICNRADRPVQFVFAGKAHPRDNEAKRILQQIFSLKYEPRMIGRAAFLVNYDQYLGRKLVQGTDVWLNMPRPPQEASGTSGQKAALNGVVNCSVLDGWWIEGHDGKNGWTVGSSDGERTTEEEDAMDARSLYDLIEHEIAPLFYERDENGVPRGWVARMKASIRTIAPVFNTHRMVREYAARMYGDRP